jgi:hypothetical protein
MFVPFGQLPNPVLQRLVFFFNGYWLFKGIAAQAYPTTAPAFRFEGW